MTSIILKTISQSVPHCRSSRKRMVGVMLVLLLMIGSLKELWFFIFEFLTYVLRGMQFVWMTFVCS